jgi:hypothetical protein
MPSAGSPSDARGDPHGALVLAEDHAEFDGFAVGIPTGILWEREKHHCDLPGEKLCALQLFYSQLPTTQPPLDDKLEPGAL